MPEMRDSHDRYEREDRQRGVRQEENLVEALQEGRLDMRVMHPHREDGSRVLRDGHMIDECEPCYCGWTGLDSDGCTCLPDLDRSH